MSNNFVDANAGGEGDTLLDLLLLIDLVACLLDEVVTLFTDVGDLTSRSKSSKNLLEDIVCDGSGITAKE